MKLARVKSRVLNSALESKKFSLLGLYLHGIMRDEGTFICEVVEYQGKPTLEMKLALSDYFFNEPESKGLWDFAENLIGKKEIDMHVLKVVEL